MVSITFASPQYLWFLFSVPFLIVTHFFLLRHTKHKAMKFANFVAIKRVTGERFITKNYTILTLRVFIIVCATLAVAQTMVWYEGRTNENEYVIAIDTSASMTTTDVLPSRLEAAKLNAVDFADALDPNTRVGLVSFSGVTFIEQPLTLSKSDFKKAVEPLDTIASGTDIPGAIITSVNVISSSDRGRAVVLLTDGSNTIEDFNSKSLQRAVTYAGINHVKIYTIGVGTEAKTPIGYLPSFYNVSATYNENNLEYIANMTGGKYYFAANVTSLAGAYDDIKAADKVSTLKVDLTGGLMLACLILLLIEWGLINTRFRTIP